MILRWARELFKRQRADREAQLLEARAIPDGLWLDTLRLFPFLRWRSVEQVERLRALATLFLARKEFSTTQGLALTDEMAVAIAAQACLPIIELGLATYDGFVGIVVSPDEVVAQREWMDEDGVVHTGEEVLAGEAMAGGPVLLSWRDASEAGWTAEDGYNVVIHEFAHVLDMSDGQDADGRPPLADRASESRWERVMGPAFDRHAHAVDQEAPTWLDPYAAQGPEEFFAVCCEAFFVAPNTLRTAEAAVYALLADYFRQDPAVFQD
jgi:MtfA peptidase